LRNPLILVSISN
jgi:hypothetical protein